MCAVFPGDDKGINTGKGQSRYQSAGQQKVSNNKGESVASPDHIHESLGGFPLADTQGKHQEMPPPLLQSNSFSPEPELTPEPNLLRNIPSYQTWVNLTRSLRNCVLRNDVTI